ncbi:hypothetical protein GMO_15300 [Gluconobacter morbifer G707]|uniref:Uncharacterized protein n=1 Tax=Gluconobacter morbifer G707 TaxID=1088869 RepID=G6XJ64_9PROT|nr:hypothetical protein GMO_15300 [Gluconobacter morbifer G707]
MPVLPRCGPVVERQPIDTSRKCLRTGLPDFSLHILTRREKNGP